MDLAVRCSRKAVKLNHSLTRFHIIHHNHFISYEPIVWVIIGWLLVFSECRHSRCSSFVLLWYNLKYRNNKSRRHIQLILDIPYHALKASNVVQVVSIFITKKWQHRVHVVLTKHCIWCSVAVFSHSFHKGSLWAHSLNFGKIYFVVILILII